MSVDIYDVAAATVLTMSGGNGNLTPGADWLRKQYIVIDRADLPEVTREGNRYLVDGETYTWDFTHPHSLAPEHSGMTTAERMRSIAKKALAVALFAEANPPVDEAQVDALARVLGDVSLYVDSAVVRADETLARRLVERGVRVEVSKP